MFSKDIFSRVNLINLTVLTIPASHVAGNLVLNLNILFLIILSLIFYGKELFKEKFTQIDTFVLIIFLYIVINGIFNNLYNFDFNSSEKNIVIKKSLLFTRFLILYFVIKFLIINKIINFKFLFLIFGLYSLFVSIDIIVQYFIGSNLFGFEGSGRRLSGIFGDEYIAGPFIQKFYIFFLFYFLIFAKVKGKLLFYFSLSSIILISALGIIFSGNRIPFMLFILSLIMIFIFEKSLRKFLLLISFIFICSFLFLSKSNKDLYTHYDSFLKRGYQIINYLKIKLTSQELSAENTNVYIKEFESGIYTWEKNKIFGGGVKSFYWNCSSIDRNKMLLFVYGKGQVNCNSHPHNYYLQIAGELGVIGLLLFVITFLFILKKSLQKLRVNDKSIIEIKLLIPFFIVFFVDIFPFKTTGSFFSTASATFLFLILSFVVGLIEEKKL